MENLRRAYSSLFRILILFLALFTFYTVTTQFWTDFNGLYFFVVFTLLFLALVMPLELSNVVGTKKIFQLKKFEWTKLLIIVLVVFEFFNMNNYNGKVIWFGVNEHHLRALLWFLVIFIYRHNYIVISSYRIKSNLMKDGFVKSVALNWDFITNIDFNENSIIIYSKDKDKKIEIDIDDIQEFQREEFRTLIETNFKKVQSSTH